MDDIFVVDCRWCRGCCYVHFAYYMLFDSIWYHRVCMVFVCAIVDLTEMLYAKRTFNIWSSVSFFRQLNSIAEWEWVGRVKGRIQRWYGILYVLVAVCVCTNSRHLRHCHRPTCVVYDNDERRRTVLIYENIRCRNLETTENISLNSIFWFSN